MRQISDMEPSMSCIVLDSCGDLTLVVGEGEKQKTFLVSSKAMRLASPVWKVMLDPSGHFRESNPENSQVTFPEDDGVAMQHLLRIVHYHFDCMPKSLLFIEILNLSILCDKYDVVNILKPWLPDWLKGFNWIACKPGNEESLFISWVFQDAHVFKSVAQTLVKESSINKFGQCITKEGRVLEENMPPGVIGKWGLALVQNDIANTMIIREHSQSSSTTDHGSIECMQ